MQTPKKTKGKFKVITTADTLRSKENSHYNTANNQHQILYTDVQTNLGSIKTKLKFDSVEKIDRSRLISKNYKAEQISYRNKMKEELDMKFASFLHKQKVAKVFLHQQKKSNNLQQCLQKIRKNITILFKQFLWSIKQHKIKELNQFYLGLLLKNMNFINNILYDRKIVLSLFHDFAKPTIFHLFVFLVYLTVINSHPAKNQLQASIKMHIYDLYLNEGIKIHELLLNEGLQEAKQLAIKKQYQILRVNRQNRPTFVSLSHQKARINI